MHFWAVHFRAAAVAADHASAREAPSFAPASTASPQYCSSPSGLHSALMARAPHSTAQAPGPHQMIPCPPPHPVPLNLIPWIPGPCPPQTRSTSRASSCRRASYTTSSPSCRQVPGAAPPPLLAYQRKSPCQPHCWPLGPSHPRGPLLPRKHWPPFFSTPSRAHPLFSPVPACVRCTPACFAPPPLRMRCARSARRPRCSARRRTRATVFSCSAHLLPSPAAAYQPASPLLACEVIPDT
jgi:hypothetical protein